MVRHKTRWFLVELSSVAHGLANDSSNDNSNDNDNYQNMSRRKRRKIEQENQRRERNPSLMLLSSSSSSQQQKQQHQQQTNFPTRKDFTVQLRRTIDQLYPEFEQQKQKQQREDQDDDDDDDDGNQQEDDDDRRDSRSRHDHYHHYRNVISSNVQIKWYDVETRLVLIRIARQYTTHLHTALQELLEGNRKSTTEHNKNKQNKNKKTERSVRDGTTTHILSIHGSARTAKMGIIKQLTNVYRSRLLELQLQQRQRQQSKNNQHHGDVEQKEQCRQFDERIQQVHTIV